MEFLSPVSLVITFTCGFIKTINLKFIVIVIGYKKGYAFEREIKLKLEEDGWRVIRSGGSKKPDLVAGRRGKILIIECKVTKKTKIYLEKDEVRGLSEVAVAFGAEAIFAVKVDNRGWSLVTIDSLKETGKHFMVEL